MYAIRSYYVLPHISRETSRQRFRKSRRLSMATSMDGTGQARIEAAHDPADLDGLASLPVPDRGADQSLFDGSPLALDARAKVPGGRNLESVAGDPAVFA